MSEFLEKFKLGNSKKLIENLVIFLILVIILMIVMNTIFFENKNSNNTKSIQVSKTVETGKTDELEIKLKNILTKISGAGNVEVMISYLTGTEEVPMYNVTEGVTTTNEKDTSGGERKIEQKDYEKTIVFKEGSGLKEPVVQKINMPENNPLIQNDASSTQGSNMLSRPFKKKFWVGVLIILLVAAGLLIGMIFWFNKGLSIQPFSSKNKLTGKKTQTTTWKQMPNRSRKKPPSFCPAPAWSFLKWQN
jgi:stage III sporulation protein AG